MLLFKKKLSSGFTLIELLVAISILGVLASLTLSSYSGAQKQTRDTERRSDLNQYRNALETYAGANNGVYPVKTSEFEAASFCNSGEALEDYLSSCPTDPNPGTVSRVYYYLSDTSGLSYALYANLETSNHYWVLCSNGNNQVLTSKPTDVGNACASASAPTATPTI
jgi:prepilin-type N-terminal cleavage/methylation domain-containing protein